MPILGLCNYCLHARGSHRLIVPTICYNRIKQNYRRPRLERRVRVKSTMNARDLPQGVLDCSAFREVAAIEEATYPTVIRQARDNMRKFDQCVLLTRVGSFYELYFEQAEEYGPQLNLKVGYKRTTAGRVAMAGFPFFQLDRFLKILVQDLRKSVAISEHFANRSEGKAKPGELMFDRKVARVVTPGTLVDEKFMDPYSNNFLLAIYLEDDGIGKGNGRESSTIENFGTSILDAQPIGLAWLDLSTGEFFTQTTSFMELPSSLARIGAKEIVLSSNLDDGSRQVLSQIVGPLDVFLAWQEPSIYTPSVLSWNSMLESPLNVTNQLGFSRQEIYAGSMLLSYVHDRLQRVDLKLQTPVRRLLKESMAIDKNTMKGLELLETIRDGSIGSKGSLLHTIKRTFTKGGFRLLQRRITSPSLSQATINGRLDLVAKLMDLPSIRKQITRLLRHTTDSQRVIQKFSLGRADVDDLLALRKTIILTEDIFNLLQKVVNSQVIHSNDRGHEPLKSLLGRLSLAEPKSLAEEIAHAIDEDGISHHDGVEKPKGIALVPMTQDASGNEIEARKSRMHAQGSLSGPVSLLNNDSMAMIWTMKCTASDTLAKLHHELNRLMNEKTNLAMSLRDQLDASSLTLRWTPALGHFCHVKGSRDVRASHERILSAKGASASKHTKSFYLKEWSTLGTNIDGIKEQIDEEEARVFQHLREAVIKNISKLRRNAAVLDELDVACSSAILALEQRLVRPHLNESIKHQVIAGRHPSVEIGLEKQGRSFVPNNCVIGEHQRVWLITGPNMGGKSTFLRQNAIVSVLAQMGSFVPAEYADIGLVDQIFSRIGAADNLYQNQSTFMVEMLETASILKLATSRSFVIMDEVGRGTTPEDGLAVSYACLHHLYHINRCRTLFSTHFHQLAEMTTSWRQLGVYCTDIEEAKDGSFHYVHRLQPGVNKESHALKVAHLAGLPRKALEVAEEFLRHDTYYHQLQSNAKVSGDVAPAA